MAGSGLRSVASASHKSGPLQVAKWEESPGIEHHEALLRFTLKNSTKGLSITGRGRGLREALAGAPLLPSSPFPSPGQCAGGGCLSPPMPLLQASHSEPWPLAVLKLHRGKKVRRGRAESKEERDRWGQIEKHRYKGR